MRRSSDKSAASDPILWKKRTALHKLLQDRETTIQLTSRSFQGADQSSLESLSGGFCQRYCQFHSCWQKLTAAPRCQLRRTIARGLDGRDLPSPKISRPSGRRTRRIGLPGEWRARGGSYSSVIKIHFRIRVLFWLRFFWFRPHYATESPAGHEPLASRSIVHLASLFAAEPKVMTFFIIKRLAHQCLKIKCNMQCLEVFNLMLR